MKKRLASLFLALVLCFSFTGFTFANDINDKKDELKETQENIGEIKDQIDEAKDKQDSVLNELKKLEAQSDKVQDEISEMKNQLSTTKKNIQVTTKELDKIVKEYNKQKETYEERVKAIYMNGPSGYLDIILSSDGFSDFFTRMDMVKKIVEYDRNVLKEMVDKQQEISKKKTALEAEQKKLASLESGLAAKKSELDAANASRKKVYNSLEKDISALEKALDDEIAESNEIASEIKRLQQAANNNNGGGNSGGGSQQVSKTGIIRVSDLGYTPRITSPYGMRWHPVLQKEKMHTGIDVGIPTGTPIYSMAGGKVIISKYSSSYGHYIVVDHGGGLSSLYAHLSSRLVSVGQTVEKGQMIAKSGSTGRSTGPHLHFEVRINGNHTNPVPSYYSVGQ